MLSYTLTQKVPQKNRSHYPLLKLVSLSGYYPLLKLALQSHTNTLSQKVYVFSTHLCASSLAKMCIIVQIIHII